MHGSDILVKKEGFLVLCTILRIFLQPWFSTIYRNLGIEKVLKDGSPPSTGTWILRRYKRDGTSLSTGTYIGKERRRERKRKGEERGTEGSKVGKEKGKKGRREGK